MSIIPIAGDIDDRQTGVKIERLKTVSTEENREGVRVTLKGGSWGASQNLHGVVDFVCSKDSDVIQEPEFESWDLSVLKLKWMTSYACENATSTPGHDDGSNKGDGKDNDEISSPDERDSWGWFTWLFIIIVLGSAGYVIAGAWINYNRYGLSGVDILPHADLLRDIPFLFGDLIRKIAGTFSAGSNRGGYSAV